MNPQEGPQPPTTWRTLAAGIGMLVCLACVFLWPDSLLALTLALIGAFVATWLGWKNLREYRRARVRGRGGD